jgi:glycosyltransferase involved in cell wall biosynthesis
MNSIIIPVHNEAEHLSGFISKFLTRIVAEIPGESFEILIVENGSTDFTAEIAKGLERQYSQVRCLKLDRGSYGEAIKLGLLESSGELLIILEVDFLKPEFVSQALEVRKERQTKFIVASKRHPDSKDQRPLKRRILTEAFNRLINRAIGYPGTDTHGLKAIDANLARNLCELTQTSDEALQTELVVIAWALGEQIVEVPIEIEEKRSSPVSIIRRIPMVLTLIQELRSSLNRFNSDRVERKKPLQL